MMSLNKMIMSGLLVLGATVVPAIAGPVTWTFNNDANDGGVVFGDGTKLSGSFDFDPTVTTRNQPYGQYSAFNVTTTQGFGPSVVFGPPGGLSSGVPLIPASGSWFVNTNNWDDGTSSDDCCSDNTGFTATLSAISTPTVGSGDPVSPDLTNANYFVILFDSAITGDSTTVVNGTKIYLNSLGGSAICADPVCGAANFSPYTALHNNSSYIIASGGVVPSGAPEPSTFVMLGGALIGLGATRKRIFRSR